MNRKTIWLGVIVGSTVGGCVPSLWHASAFSLWSVLFSTIGALAGIWVARRWMG